MALRSMTVTRRRFLTTAAKTSAILAAPMFVPGPILGKDGAVAAGERITLAGLGIGERGAEDLGCFLNEPVVQVVAIADVRKDRREFVKQVAEAKYGPGVAMYRDFREMLPREDIDAVLIATGDRWHTLASIYAAKAGNQSYPGNNIIKLSNGNLLTSVAEAKPLGKGSMCFIGTWNQTANDYQWMAGNPVVAPAQAGYLNESEVAQLKDGRVLVAWRGAGGHKWYSISTDGGVSLSPVAELKYDDGSSFYSPASYHSMVRSNSTHKLYWIGNIIPTPPDPDGNTPRYPLVIAEVDESGATPALKKNTVTVIDDRQPGQPYSIHFSNFNVFENRETYALDMYMTLYGEDPNDPSHANNYKYVITLVPEPSSLVLLGMGTFGLICAKIRRHARQRRNRRL